jgi:crotonobetainyl-CoA:carnitine CoA-transferase CaiB-like acyl-CoA transferase
MGDHMTGLGMAGAIAAALLARERTGRRAGDPHVALPERLWMLASDIQARDHDRLLPHPGRAAAAPNPLFNFYRTKDGAGST